MTQQTVRLVLGPAVRSGHRGSRSTAFVPSNSVTFESALRRDVLTLRALGRNLADVLEQPVHIDSPGADDRACDEVVEGHLVRTLAVLGETTPQVLLAAYRGRRTASPRSPRSGACSPWARARRPVATVDHGDPRLDGCRGGFL